jgi:hypothetical protein
MAESRHRAFKVDTPFGQEELDRVRIRLGNFAFPATAPSSLARQTLV